MGSKARDAFSRSHMTVKMAEGEVKDCSIFPPSNHEGLPIQSQDQQDPPSSSPLSSSLPSRFDVPDSILGYGLPRWFSFGLHLLHSKLLAIASSFRRCSNTRLAFWPFGPAGLLVLAFVYITLRRRRRPRPHSCEGTLDQLMRLIKERDEVGFNFYFFFFFFLLVVVKSVNFSISPFICL